MPFGDELLALDIWSLSSVMYFVVTDLSGFVAIFKKTFVLKLYSELRHLRTARDWNLTCCMLWILHFNTPVCRQWWSGVMWCHKWLVVGCLDLPSPFPWRSWEGLSCRCTPDSAWFCLQDLCCSSQGCGEPAPLSSVCPLLATLCWVKQALPFPIHVLLLWVFVQAVGEGQMDVFGRCCCWGGYERRDVERRRCVLLWRVPWWEGATVAPWLWIIGPAKIIKNLWTVLCSCWDGILLAFFQLLSEE